VSRVCRVQSYEHFIFFGSVPISVGPFLPARPSFVVHRLRGNVVSDRHMEIGDAGIRKY